MTTITINQDADLDKLNFESLDDLKAYLFEQQQWETLQSESFYAELDRRAALAIQNRSNLKTLDDLTSKLNERK
ncbi:MAG: hypothetical protein NWQ55_08940 [Salibacteraceae bacterium]|jgi:hypothetical protein|nr:hypothetical protein [Salibacteraceae bacterium]MDP4686134.1 hypothetical protein [Salibacteraceae bacterium]MDP4763676.1 hypothetical protein [Salibacteraceae bacterium]MDP4844672.1 hypothetical protein [Salibacteraceae bacterium]MDP4934472.1 hypothetical protein [Salibacteraceae bacterium]